MARRKCTRLGGGVLAVEYRNVKAAFGETLSRHEAWKPGTYDDGVVAHIFISSQLDPGVVIFAERLKPTLLVQRDLNGVHSRLSVAPAASTDSSLG